MNDEIGARHPLPSDPSSFSEAPAGQHLTLGRMAEILRASGCVVYASSEPPIPKAAIERLPEAFITSNSGDGKYYVKIAVKSMADLYKWHDAAIIAARGPDVEPYAWQYAKSNGDDTWSVHIDRLGQKPAVHENFEPKALYLAGSLPYLSATPSPIEDVAEPSVLNTVRAHFANQQTWKAGDLVARMPSVPKKEVYNALTYMTRTNELNHGGHGLYTAPPSFAARRVRPSPVDEDARDGVVEARVWKQAAALAATWITTGPDMKIGLAIAAAMQAKASQSHRKG